MIIPPLRLQILAHVLASYFGMMGIMLYGVVWLGLSVRAEMLPAVVFAPVTMPLLLLPVMFGDRGAPRAIVLVYLLPFALVTFLLMRSEARRQRRDRWIDHGLCGACGYDLRASMDRCPECGSPRADRWEIEQRARHAAALERMNDSPTHDVRDGNL